MRMAVCYPSFAPPLLLSFSLALEMIVDRKDDLVLAISIYSSEKKTKYLSFFVLGSQTLDTLANSIYCYNNYSENKNHGTA